MSGTEARQLLAQEGLAHIPKILTLQDRNPHSPTYGCFDRNHWHYRIIDFPTGMSQELVWPLTLAWDLPIPGNPYHRDPTIREWAVAGMRYAARSAHRDGSCDDYFPHERAGGAASFSLLGFLDSYRRLGLADPDLRAFFRRRADWLARFHESGQLTNHQALVALVLALMGRLESTDRWAPAVEERVQRILSWQHPEGWFQEYEGCDPGYQSITIALLARLHDLAPREDLRDSLSRAVDFAAEFVFPDGGYGSELGSRNTYNAFLSGFERVGRWKPEALRTSDRVLEGVAAGLGACHADDHHVGHHMWDRLLAWEDYVPERPPAAARPQGRRHFEGAGLLVDRRGDEELYVALNKGGAFRHYAAGQLTLSDTHLSVLVDGGGQRRNAVGHMVGPYALRLSPDEIVVSGKLGWAKQRQMTTGSLVALRGVMATVGRPFPNLVRSRLQRMLIQGKDEAPYPFTRRFLREADGWVVEDELRAPSWKNVAAVGIGGHQCSIYVTMSRTYQDGQRQPWLDLTERIRGLAEGEPLRLRRRLGA